MPRATRDNRVKSPFGYRWGFFLYGSLITLVPAAIVRGLGRHLTIAVTSGFGRLEIHDRQSLA
jgi:hypothetical protein